MTASFSYFPSSVHSPQFCSRFCDFQSRSVASPPYFRPTLTTWSTGSAAWHKCRRPLWLELLGKCPPFHVTSQPRQPRCCSNGFTWRAESQSTVAQTLACVTCMSAIFVNECLMFVGDRFFSQIELWNHDSKSIALIKTSKSVITVDCFVFRSILTCPRMNHNITSLTRPYRGVQQMVCGRYLSTVILHNGSVNTSTCLARESGVR